MNIHECCACGEEFNLDAGGIAYQGREGLVHMCETHVPDDFCDEGLADEMGLSLREEADYWDDE